MMAAHDTSREEMLATLMAGARLCREWRFASTPDDARTYLLDYVLCVYGIDGDETDEAIRVARGGGDAQEEDR
jgi:hypothetical protein